MTNLIAVLAFAAVIWFEIKHANREVSHEVPDQISMSQEGDTTIYYHNDNIIYYKVGDSVLLDFIDSVRFQRLVDSTGIKRRPSTFH